jgi:hypothetical protein
MAIPGKRYVALALAFIVAMIMIVLSVRTGGPVHSGAMGTHHYD